MGAARAAPTHTVQGPHQHGARPIGHGELVSSSDLVDPLDGLSIDCYIAHRCPGPTRHSSWRASAVRKFILSSVLTMAMLLLTVATVLADSTGPGI